MYNNYGYNPYYQPRYSNAQNNQAIQQPIQSQFDAAQMRLTLTGKQVDSIDMAKNSEYPLDGSISYFPITDNSAIVTKQITNDGTPKITIYKPIEEQKQEIRYITQEELKKSLNELNFDELDDIKEEIKELKSEIKDLKKRKKDE